jgi:cystathionine beta-lyase/cystathionine gamma-synthase
MRIAEWCAGQRGIKAVHYPGLPDHEDHAVASELLDGFGAMLGIEVSGGARGLERVIRRLKLWAHAPSLGGVDSLVSEPRHTSHAHLSAEERAKAGIPDGFLRLSVGIEDADDLIADLEHALHA